MLFARPCNAGSGLKTNIECCVMVENQTKPVKASNELDVSITKSVCMYSPLLFEYLCDKREAQLDAKCMHKSNCSYCHMRDGMSVCWKHYRVRLVLRSFPSQNPKYRNKLFNLWPVRPKSIYRIHLWRQREYSCVDCLYMRRGLHVERLYFCYHEELYDDYDCKLD